jgi:DNA-binding PadR family transcriptional regulator
MTGLMLGEFEEMVLLGILHEGSNAFSLQIRDEIERVGRKRVTRGAFYTTVERLKKKGLVRWQIAKPEAAEGGGSQRLFSVTPDGIAALRFTRNTLEARRARLDQALGQL